METPSVVLPVDRDGGGTGCQVDDLRGRIDVRIDVVVDVIRERDAGHEEGAYRYDGDGPREFLLET